MPKYEGDDGGGGYLKERLHGAISCQNDGGRASTTSLFSSKQSRRQWDFDFPLNKFRWTRFTFEVGGLNSLTSFITSKQVSSLNKAFHFFRKHLTTEEQEVPQFKF